MIRLIPMINIAALSETQPNHSRTIFLNFNSTPPEFLCCFKKQKREPRGSLLLYNSWRKILIGCKRKQSDYSCAFDGSCYLALVLGAGACDTARDYLTAFRYIFFEFVNVFVIDVFNLINAEMTDLRPALVTFTVKRCVIIFHLKASPLPRKVSLHLPALRPLRSPLKNQEGTHPRTRIPHAGFPYLRPQLRLTAAAEA